MRLLSALDLIENLVKFCPFVPYQITFRPAYMYCFARVQYFITEIRA